MRGMTVLAGKPVAVSPGGGWMASALGYTNEFNSPLVQVYPYDPIGELYTDGNVVDYTTTPGLC